MHKEMITYDEIVMHNEMSMQYVNEHALCYGYTLRNSYAS